MTTARSSRLGAACGAVFAVALFVASGNGDEAYLAPRAVAGLAALALFVPFLAYLCSVLRGAEGEGGWLATTALVAGTVGITIKIISVVPALALHHARIADGTQLHRLFDALDNAATVIALYPLAIACAAIAAAALRTAALPRWLAAGAALTAVALAVNGAFLEATFVPALLLFLVWTLAASIHLSRRAFRATGRRFSRIETAAGS
jgi:hypothetical protein